MKTTEEIAAECGITGQEEKLLHEILGESDEWPETGNIIGALYRRIEKLENLNEQIPDLTQQQMSINFNWLLVNVDRIHSALCPTMMGTWQQRAEQAVAAAVVIGAQNDAYVERITREGA